MTAFTDAQVKSLEAKLDSKHVRTRRVQDTTLAYVEGWHVIAEANRISALCHLRAHAGSRPSCSLRSIARASAQGE